MKKKNMKTHSRHSLAGSRQIAREKTEKKPQVCLPNQTTQDLHYWGSFPQSSQSSRF